MRGGLSPAAGARRWLACALAVAALAAVVGQPAPPPPVYASGHGTAADNPGKYWAPGTADTYAEYTHTNRWRCAGRAASLLGVSVTIGCAAQELAESEDLPEAPLPNGIGTVLTRTCRVTTATGGCGHTGGNGWVWVSGPYHDQPNTPIGNPICSTTGAEVTSAALCGQWVACAAGTQPNSATAPTGCVACPSGQHSHGGAASDGGHPACEAAHEPVCADGAETWAPDHAGHASAPCEGGEETTTPEDPPEAPAQQPAQQTPRPVACPAGQVPQADSGGTVRCLKQCPGGGWVAAAVTCRPAPQSEAAHPCWGLTPQTAEAEIDYDHADNPWTYRGGPARPKSHEWRFYAPVSVDGRGHLEWENTYIRAELWRLGRQEAAMAWAGGGDGVDGNDNRRFWAFSGSYDFARPPTAGAMRAPPSGWAASAAVVLLDGNDRARTCATIDSRPARVDVTVTGGTFGCKQIAPVYARWHSPGSPDRASFAGFSPTATTDSGLAALAVAAPRRAGRLAPPGVRPRPGGDHPVRRLVHRHLHRHMGGQGADGALHRMDRPPGPGLRRAVRLLVRLRGARHGRQHVGRLRRVPRLPGHLTGPAGGGAGRVRAALIAAPNNEKPTEPPDRRDPFSPAWRPRPRAAAATPRPGPAP